MNDYYGRNETTRYNHGHQIVQYGDADTLQVEMIVKVPAR